MNAPRPEHAWLPLALPAATRRVRVHDAGLATELAATSAELVDAEADVEIGPAAAVGGEARNVLVPLAAREPLAALRLARGAARAGRAVRLLAQTGRARRTLHGRGYAATRVIRWERGRPLALRADVGASRTLLGAVVTTVTADDGPTVLEEAVAAAAGEARADTRCAIGSSGVVTAPLDGAVLRVGFGRAGGAVVATREAVTAVAEALCSDAMLPIPQVSGRTPFAEWSLERRVPGSAPAELSQRTLDECIELLVELHTRTETGGPVDLTPAAETLGLVAQADERWLLARVADSLNEALSELPLGYCHGDFWRGNLLVDGSRLSGVVDWGAATPDGLPLVDLLHLLLSERRPRGRDELGPAFLRHLWAVDIRDLAPVRAYLATHAITPTPTELRAVVAAYWLTMAARELRDPDRPADARRAPVLRPLHAIGEWLRAAQPARRVQPVAVPR